MRIYRRGDEGSGVSEIRSILAGRGLLPAVGSEDTGIFDDACDHAVRAFQQERGLIVDGVVGPATRSEEHTSELQ